MDWNKSNTILIIAFIILNIFLLAATFSYKFTDDAKVAVNEDFKSNVENLLKSKNININCEIPDKTYVMPVLETEFEIIQINNELLEKYLGKGVAAIDGVFVYNNANNEKLEIVDNKKIIYTIRDKVHGEITGDEFISKTINSFLDSKNIDKKGFAESNRFISKDGSCITYTQSYNNFELDNSYMRFYIDVNGIYKFEMQRISLSMETKNETRTVTAVEALPRLMAYDDIKDKDITEVKMTYYSRQDVDWQYIKRTNLDPTWKVVFSDGNQQYLPGFD